MFRAEGDTLWVSSLIASQKIRHLLDRMEHVCGTSLLQLAFRRKTCLDAETV